MVNSFIVIHHLIHAFSFAKKSLLFNDQSPARWCGKLDIRIDLLKGLFICLELLSDL